MRTLAGMRLLRRPAFATVAALLVAGALGAAPAPATAATTSTWLLGSVGHVNGLTQGQGLATVEAADGSTSLFFTGNTSVPPTEQALGWNHDGDPDSAQGAIFEAYQAADGNATTKAFHVTRADGQAFDYVHDLVPGEQMNNSFAAVAPGGQWMVAGEWDQMTRLLVFPTPVLNPTTPTTGGSLPLAAQITLDTPITDIQGCTFQTATRLLCSSDDPIAQHGIPRKALLQLDLAHALDGTDVAATVTPLFALPLPDSECPVTQPGSWPGDMEVEGVDFDPRTQLLRVIVIPPGACGLDARVDTYQTPQATAAALVVTAPATAVTGAPVTVTVSAVDAAGRPVTAYQGTVTLTSSDPRATLGPVTFSGGTGTATVTFGTVGSQTVTATDTVVPAITGTSGAVVVTAPLVTPVVAPVAPAPAVAATPSFTG